MPQNLIMTRQQLHDGSHRAAPALRPPGLGPLHAWFAAAYVRLPSVDRVTLESMHPMTTNRLIRPSLTIHAGQAVVSTLDAAL
jgi:hypothetical protein